MTDEDDQPPPSKLTRSKERWAREGRFLTGKTSRPEEQRLPPGQHLTKDVQDRLDELGNRARSSGDSESVEALLAHGRLLHDLLPAVDNTLTAMRALPRNRDQDSLRAMILMRQGISRTTARQYRRLLYGTSLLLVGFLVYLGLRLRTRANALQRRAAFEHVLGKTFEPKGSQTHLIIGDLGSAAPCGAVRAVRMLADPLIQ
jgi:hypothetical protein